MAAMPFDAGHWPIQSGAAGERQPVQSRAGFRGIFFAHDRALELLEKLARGLPCLVVRTGAALKVTREGVSAILSNSQVSIASHWHSATKHEWDSSQSRAGPAGGLTLGHSTALRRAQA